MEKSLLFKHLISDDNIYRAIYSLDSYVFEKKLLSPEDSKLFLKLRDKFDIDLIKDVTKEVRSVIEKVILKDDILDIQVYHRFKSVDSEGKIIFRPLHTTSLINQIAIVAMLHLIMYDYTLSEGTKLSNISRLIPDNFYGNKPSLNPKYLFCKWQDMYKQYSSDINESYAKYYENQKFKYEISLDLKNFFPSINPLLIYNYITSKIPISIKDLDLILLKKITFKLLYFKVTNIKEFNTMYYNKTPKNNFSIGLPQGLPHSYFFGNVCMIIISNIFDEVFHGDSYYYVDDSVIFTNNLDKKNLLEDFNKKLILINQKIKEKTMINVQECAIKNIFLDIDLFEQIKEFQKEVDYSIEIHTKDKSKFAEIQNENTGERFLNILSREASMGAMQINSIIDDNDHNIIYSRLRALNSIIEHELEIIKDRGNNENYKKKLVKFRKYFKFRLRLLEFKSTNDSNELIEEIMEELSFDKSKEIKDNSDFDKFIEYYDEDIFISTFNFIITSVKDQKLLKELADKIEEFESYILNNNNIDLYFSKCIKTIIDLNSNLYAIDSYNAYRSLIKYSNINLDNFKNASEETKQNYLLSLLPNLEDFINKNDLSSLCNSIFKDAEITKYFILVDKLTPNIKRILLNCIFSSLFSVELNDRNVIQKLNSKIISVTEFRILVHLRSKYFNPEKFLILLKQIRLDEIRKLDFSIYEVINHFSKYVRDPNLVDELILIHQFTSDYWKNGSKYLYFYTQHNQEHATNLINNCIKIINSIGYLQISSKDYYLVFCSCYLHDISMVLYPDKNKLLYDYDIESNIILNNIRQEILNHYDFLDFKNLKSILLDANEKLDYFFESKIRNTHAKQSSNFIRTNEDLDFIDSTARETIAEISEAHTYDPRDVYKIKSNAKNSLISKKFDKIVLRIADILDIGEERVSNIFFKNNINNMNEESRFQWLSHYLISSYSIQTKYSIKDKKTQNSSLDSYLKNRSISEEITININIKYNQLTKVEKSLKCNKSQIKEINQDSIEIELNNSICTGECNFMCKWMHVKNKYMFEEFYALQEYLSDNIENYFDSKIVIKLVLIDGYIESNYIDIINRYIEENYDLNP